MRSRTPSMVLEETIKFLPVDDLEYRGYHSSAVKDQCHIAEKHPDR